MTSFPKRRRPRFSLRTLFAVVTLFGCWLGYELNWIRQRREAIQAGIAVPHTFAAQQIIPEPPLGFRWLGEDGERHLFAAASQFDRICQLFPESEVIEWPVTNTSRHRDLNLAGSTRISTTPCSPAKPQTPATR